MEIKVLGPLEVLENGVSVAPSACKPRQVLALLALRAGRVVPVPTLMEEIWGERIPQSAVTTLQTYILQLRRKLAAAQESTGGDRSSKDILATTYGGYLLSPDGSRVTLRVDCRACKGTGRTLPAHVLVQVGR
ncbi:AfsR/SARP family transcriptional regulator, partial [Streptomyces sp. NPDC003233]